MKKVYIKPVAIPVNLVNEDIMLTASPGIGGDYDPNEEIGAKKNGFFEEDETADEWPIYSSWGE